MSTHRLQRLQEEVHREVSAILLFEVTDPLLRGLIITRALMTKDLSLARIYYEAPGSEKDRPLFQQGLERAKGFIRKQLSVRLPLKTIPKLEFFHDDLQEEISRVDELFSKIDKTSDRT